VLLAVLGILAVLALGAGAGTARAQEPPPRPTRLTPPGGDSDPEPQPTPVPLGRITGTVIELQSGAPAAGVTVHVGAMIVVTDANGNYDVPGLTAGAYEVGLNLAPGQGEAAQGSLTVQLDPGGLVVQHLAFRAPTPTPVATPQPEPVIVPQTLPATGAAAEGSTWPVLGLGLIFTLGGLALRRGSRR